MVGLNLSICPRNEFVSGKHPKFQKNLGCFQEESKQGSESHHFNYGMEGGEEGRDGGSLHSL